MKIKFGSFEFEIEEEYVPFVGLFISGIVTLITLLLGGF